LEQAREEDRKGNGLLAGISSLNPLSGIGLLAELRNRNLNQEAAEYMTALVVFNYEPTDTFREVAGIVRGLSDGDLWALADDTGNVRTDDITEGQTRLLVEVWQKIPISGKTEDLPNYISAEPNDEQLEMMFRDVAAFSAAVNIMSTAELQEQTARLAREGILSANPDTVRRSDKLYINAIYDQVHGPSREATLAERLSWIRSNADRLGLRADAAPVAIDQEGPIGAMASRILGEAWNTARGEPGYDQSLDANNDGFINSLDLSAIHALETS